TVPDLEATIADLGSQPGGGFIAMADFFLLNNREQMIAAAAQSRVPAIYPWREVTAAGGLLSYGPDLEDIVRRAAPYVNRVLHGENPADLPVQVPTKFQLVVNLTTAKALGLTISRDFLLVADEVIEYMHETRRRRSIRAPSKFKSASRCLLSPSLRREAHFRRGGADFGVDVLFVFGEIILEHADQLARGRV